ncbi:hypothetical protein, partial [Flavobacterium sp.]|uniref:hypothetical protein n=1 Tax=Flavobacterium sp. TaxID=239 RepID=UPI0040347C2D
HLFKLILNRWWFFNDDLSNIKKGRRMTRIRQMTADLHKLVDGRVVERANFNQCRMKKSV